MNTVEREPVETRVLNPTASEASFKPKQRRYRKTNLKKKVLAPNWRCRNVPDPNKQCFLYSNIYCYTYIINYIKMQHVLYKLPFYGKFVKQIVGIVEIIFFFKNLRKLETK